MTSSDWATKDFYKVLGVSKDASADDIKKAYRKLARANHPDSHPGDKAAEDRFKAVAEAYDVIGDTEKRKKYDEMRDAFAGGFGPFGAPGRGGTTGGTTFDVNDLFGAGTSGGGFGDLFGTMFGGGGGARTTRTATPRRGADLEAEATIGFVDSIDGVTVSLRLSSDAPCPDCSGTGARSGTMPRVCPDCEGVGMRAASVGGAFTMNETCRTCGGRGLVVDDPCPTCHGSGRGLSNRTVSARIPAGVKDGQRIRLRGKGASGERGGPAGDLIVTVHVSPHRLFKRKGDNLTLTVPIAFHEAALGAEVKVPTLGEAPVTVRIPPGTPSGRTFRVRGKGVPGKDARGVQRTGDLLVTVEVQVPAALSPEARAAVEAYRDTVGAGDLRANLFAEGAGR
ncbi:molecular chaperone DnaJ [Nocardioides mesophilus]|uniref:Chaperone protein DnaJ n=1 Tax=Nocardioides mesophilus TaxID=433659 RepID=A0A7G9RF33_9ACTN|nr:molecular chaperone DnaJ [Nocardioides mesophilus]QNN54208.1 molecular chaperone DnaJ [Nocardioides mesophilus]